MKNFKCLQNLFVLLVMGFSLSVVCACGDDEEPIQDVTPPTDVVPNDSVVAGHVMINGHEAVDLGLSVKWATCNVDANSPEEFGGYYSWGETTTKNGYSWGTYKWCKGGSYSINKYCTNNIYSTVDNKTVLDLEDDVAHVKWGGSWRMPTIEEFAEFGKCKLEWVTRNDVKGALVTGPNGNSIFLPTAGVKYGAGNFLQGADGYYCSATLYEEDNKYVYGLMFNSGQMSLVGQYRSYGFAVRPVTE